MAFTLVKDRLEQEIELGKLGFMEIPKIDYREDIPLRTDIEIIKLQGKYKKN